MKPTNSQLRNATFIFIGILSGTVYATYEAVCPEAMTAEMKREHLTSTFDQPGTLVKQPVENGIAFYTSKASLADAKYVYHFNMSEGSSDKSAAEEIQVTLKANTNNANANTRKVFLDSNCKILKVLIYENNILSANFDTAACTAVQHLAARRRSITREISQDQKRMGNSAQNPDLKAGEIDEVSLIKSGVNAQGRQADHLEALKKNYEERIHWSSVHVPSSRGEKQQDHTNYGENLCSAYDGRWANPTSASGQANSQASSSSAASQGAGTIE